MRCVTAVFGICMWAASTTLLAQAEPSNSAAAAPAFTLRYSLKTSTLISGSSGSFPGSATGFARFRMEPTVRWGGGETVEVAVEQRWRAATSGAGSFVAVVLPDTIVPYRIRPLDWQIAASDRGSWHAEVDRAAVHLPVGQNNISIGRQAIGWGRGVMFSVIDVFAPFYPLEPDREWRRGVDAVRADLALAEHLSMDAVGAFGDRLDRSIFAARFRGYAGNADLELVGGQRSGDPFGGVASSAAMGDIELHGEAAVFGTPTARETKALAGASYRVPVGHGMLVSGEYYYSAGAHAAGAIAAYEWSPELMLSGQWLHSSKDRWGVVVPSGTITFSDHWSLMMSGYVPYSRGAPISAFVQLRLYR